MVNNLFTTASNPKNQKDEVKIFFEKNYWDGNASDK